VQTTNKNVAMKWTSHHREPMTHRIKVQFTCTFTANALSLVHRTYKINYNISDWHPERHALLPFNFFFSYYCSCYFSVILPFQLQL